MPSFRRHLLTWLFFIAGTCWALADLLSETAHVYTAFLLTAALYIAGAWAAVGRAHRLLRGAISFLITLAAAVVFYRPNAPDDETMLILGFGLAACSVAFGSAGMTALAVRAVQPGAGKKREPWRISLIEMLGWMVVTAIASFALSKAKLPLEDGMGS